jgi:hypothetical protein
MRATVLTFAVLALALAATSCKDAGPTGKAVGSVQRSAEFVELEKSMWTSLSAYKETHLQSYADKLQEAPDDPLALLQTFDTLMYSISGPSGLWRAQVPQEFFGCSANHDLPICQQLSKLEMSFLPWETLHIQLAGITTEEEAQEFLEQYGEKLKQYLSYYVPAGKTLEQVQATPFFKDQLAIFLQK